MDFQVGEDGSVDEKTADSDAAGDEAGSERVKQDSVVESGDSQEVDEPDVLEDLNESVSRRKFLKVLGLGVGASGLSSMASANWAILQPVSNGKSKIDTEEIDGHYISAGSLKPSNPSVGEIFHDTDGEGIHYYDGSSWIQIDASV